MKQDIGALHVALQPHLHVKVGGLVIRVRLVEAPFGNSLGTTTLSIHWSQTVSIFALSIVHSMGRRINLSTESGKDTEAISRGTELVNVAIPCLKCGFEGFSHSHEQRVGSRSTWVLDRYEHATKQRHFRRY